MQQVVEDEQDASQIEGYGLKLGLRVTCDLSDGLHAEGEDGAAALLREVVEDEQKQLEVLHVEILVSRHRTLQRVLFKRAYESDKNRFEANVF